MKCRDIIPPFTSYYETLFDHKNLLWEAKNMKAKASDIRQQFQAIADSGFPLPKSKNSCKNSNDCKKKRKLMFSIELLLRVAALIVDNLK